MSTNPTLRLWAEPDRQDLTILMGAACGDVAGSVYEANNIRYKLDADHLIHPRSRCTDDTVMTCAIAEALTTAMADLPADWMDDPSAEEKILTAVRNSMQRFGRLYPGAGYGGKFYGWIMADDPQPYNSWGNGSAMRVSPAGWFARSLEEAEKLGALTAQVTHNHPEGVKGASVIAGCIFLLRQHGNKDAVYEYARRFYDLNFTLDSIRDYYTFDVSCQGSVPQAIVAFLDGLDFADVLSGAISIGGDSDTIAAIAGSLAEVIYPIPEAILTAVGKCLTDPLRTALTNAVRCTCERA